MPSLIIEIPWPTEEPLSTAYLADYVEDVRHRIRGANIDPLKDDQAKLQALKDNATWGKWVIKDDVPAIALGTGGVSG